MSSMSIVCIAVCPLFRLHTRTSMHMCPSQGVKCVMIYSQISTMPHSQGEASSSSRDWPLGFCSLKAESFPVNFNKLPEKLENVRSLSHNWLEIQTKLAWFTLHAKWFNKFQQLPEAKKRSGKLRWNLAERLQKAQWDNIRLKYQNHTWLLQQET